MSQALLNHVAASSIAKQVPVLKPGYTVRVHQKIKEGDKERIQLFEGLVIRIGSGNGVNKTFTVRKIVDGIGVEKTYPVFSHNIEKVEVIKAGKVRRSKLYYMRERTGKSARLREMPIGTVEMMGEEPASEAPEPTEDAETAQTDAATEKVVEETKVEDVVEETPAEETPEEPKEEATE